ncbi:MAG: hypothetical protein PHQ34_02885, partial [Methanothrix sp.]|nr:hypothetical protein [Methanothrix sp.]
NWIRSTILSASHLLDELVQRLRVPQGAFYFSFAPTALALDIASAANLWSAFICRRSRDFALYPCSLNWATLHCALANASRLFYFHLMKKQ